jgi:hypothetical protein
MACPAPSVGFEELELGLSELQTAPVVLLELRGPESKRPEDPGRA